LNLIEKKLREVRPFYPPHAYISSEGKRGRDAVPKGKFSKITR
jgi:hypothetical protein